jgi:hypothetical protein
MTFMMKRFAAVAVALTALMTMAVLPVHAASKAKTFVVTVPFDFVVANRMMPAGSYRFQIVFGSPRQNDTVGVLAVRSLDGRYYASTFTSVASGSASSDGPKLVFSRAGDRASLSQLWEQGNTVGLKLRVPASGTEVALERADETLTIIPSR